MKTLRVLTAASLAIAIAGCAVEKSSTPLSPTVAGPIAGVQITAPKPLEPASGARIPGDRQPLTLLLENASSNSPRPLSYLFEVATEPGFSNRVFTKDNVPPGDGGRTALQLPATLSMGKVYYWRAKALDGANESPYSNPNDFNVYTPVSFDKPPLIAPVNNDKVTSQRPTFAIGNVARQGSPVSVSYVIEVASDSAFATKVAVWQFDEKPGQTTFPAAADLPGGVQLFWHARAFESPVIGPWSDTQAFRTPAPVAPTPTPSPSPAPGGSCASAPSHLGVLQCRRAQYGHMSSDQANSFLRAVAHDLNVGNFSGGPFGILPKTSGNQCLGYSCDIICSANGDVYDVLIDSEGAQTPIWALKGTGASSCEIQK